MAVTFTSEVVSSAGFEYKIYFEDVHSSLSGEFKIEAGSLQINYDTNGDKKMTEILCSSCEFVWLVNSPSERNYLLGLKQSLYVERDVYVYITIMASGVEQVHWSGILLLDLGEQADEFYPYAQKIKAVDGLALLKNIDFVPSPTTTHEPYALNETYGFATNTPSGVRYAKIILWIKEILLKAGLGGANQGITEYTIATSVNWYNEKHGASQLTTDPWTITAINGECFATVKGQNLGGANIYKAMNCYDALVNICRAWGVRCIMYEQRVYFIQVGEYTIAETGTIATPVNIKTRIYDKNGILQTTLTRLGDNRFGRYLTNIENAVGTAGVRKITGTTYGEYPVVKTAVTKFNSISNTNYFQSFPLVFGQSTFPKTWSPNKTTSTIWQYKKDFTFTSLGTFTNAANLSGFYFTCSLYFFNTFSSTIKFTMKYNIRAKPSSDPTWNNITSKVLCWVNSSTGAIKNWEPAKPDGIMPVAQNTSECVGGVGTWTTYAKNYPGNSVDTGLPIIKDSFEEILDIAPGASIRDIVSNTTLGSDNIIPAHPDMNGDWDFQIIAAILPRITNNGYNGSFIQGCHGAIKKTTTTTNPEWVPPFSNIQSTSPTAPGFGGGGNCYYYNLSNSTGLNIFSPISMGTIGAAQYSTQITQNVNDSYVLKIEDTLWGDGPTNDVPSSMLVYNPDTSAWEYTLYIGRWGRGIVTGQNSFTELLCEESLNRQKRVTNQSNYVIMTSLKNTNNSNNPAYPKYINPLGLIYDPETSAKYYPIKMERYLEIDETKGMWSEII